MAVSAYMLMMRWPARRAVSLTYSFSSARAWRVRKTGQNEGSLERIHNLKASVIANIQKSAVTALPSECRG